MPKYQHILDSFSPKSYDLALDIDEVKLKFSGTVKINGQLKKPSDSLRLHSHELKIISIKSKTEISDHKIDAENQEIIIKFNEKVSGQLELEIEFSGHITEAMVGMYPANFTYKGTKQTIISTQFESHHAREVFPCVDEPSAKAVFNVQLTTASDQVVLSNGEITKQTSNDGRMTTLFTPTPKMSTYLLAFCIGNLKSLEAKSKRGVTIRTWATPDHVEHTAFALEVAVKALDEYEKFFDIEYPLDKCDLVAVPEFSAGAMENWGLITFRETALLFDPTHSREDDKMWVASVVIHELAHQWFGNLVTMRWWTDLWLNEGFARWMESYISDKLFPEWNVWDWFVGTDFIAAQNLDRMLSTHPVEIPIDHPDEIRSSFDSISYDKGASVVRMLYGYVGEEDFKESLRDYMRKHSYDNAETKDLWKAVEKVSKKPVEDFMETWTSKPGFPILSVMSESQTIELSQSRYCVSPTEDKTLWPIPINLVSQESFKQRSYKISGLLSHPLNKEYQGFYVTNYDETSLDKLYQKFDKLDDTEKMGLAIDQKHLVVTGHTSLQSSLTNTKYYKDALSAPVAEVALNILLGYRGVLTEGDQGLRDDFNAWLSDYGRVNYERLGWDSNEADDMNEQILRNSIIDFMLSTRDSNATDKAFEIFKSSKTLEDISPLYRTGVLSAIVRSSPEKADLLIDWYKEASSARAKSTLAAAITSVTESSKADDVFEFMKSEHVRIQDLLSWIAGMLRNFETSDAAWDWLRENWDYLRDRFGTDIMMTAYLPVIAGRSFSSKDKLKEYDEFFGSADTKNIEAKVKQGREMIAWKSDWHARDQKNLRAWLKIQAI